MSTTIRTIEQKKEASRRRRQVRGRARINGTKDRPRLSISKSNRFTQASLIDDVENKTMFSISTVSLKDVKAEDGFIKVAKAKEIGKKVAEFALSKKIEAIVFDRGGNRYTGRVKAVAEGAREGGLKF